MMAWLTQLRNRLQSSTFPRTRRSTSRKRARHLAVESLESRQLLATLVSGNRVTYQDVDGDAVTVSFSKSFLTANNVNTVFNFNVGSVDGDNSTPQRLNAINLSGIPATAGTNITTTVVRNLDSGGDGLATLGSINATGRDLGNVTIQGDLGRIRAGDANLKTAGLRSLRVDSLGRFGTSTGAPNLDSEVVGAVSALNVANDIKDASFRVVGGTRGKLNSVTIGGSLVGGAATLSGRIYSDGDMGSVRVDGNVQGGTGASSGQIQSNRKVNNVIIGGSLVGANGISSGTIQSTADMGSVRINANVQGGVGATSGRIQSNAKLGNVLIVGSLLGANGISSGSVFSAADMGTVRVQGNVQGGSGASSGVIQSNVRLSSVTINGSLIGLGGASSGSILSSSDMGTVRIVGSVQGGAGASSGQVSSNGKLGNVTIVGSLIGSGGASSGSVRSMADMGDVTVNGHVHGGAGVGSGQIHTSGKLARVTIGGSLTGTGAQSGRIYAAGDLGRVQIQGNIEAGAGASSGSIESNRKLASVVIGGSVVGGGGANSGNVRSQSDMGPVRIHGHLRGGAGDRSGVVQSQSRIASVQIGGHLMSGTHVRSGRIVANDDIGSVTIDGSILGSPTAKPRIQARGQASPRGSSDIAIGRLTVKGRVEYAQILVGFDTADTPRNADAQIGPVIVTGNWIASDLAAGVIAGPDNRFGTGDDAIMSGALVKNQPNVSSRIQSIVIGGNVFGTAANGDHYGIVTQHVGSLRIAGQSFALTPGGGNDDILLDTVFNDFRLREV